MPKRAIRTLIREKRDALTPGERRASSRAIHEELLSLDSFKRAKTVMLYVRLGSEVETKAAIGQALQAGKKVFVPDAVGVLDISARPVRRADPRDIDLVVVPGIAFDAQGNRIGYGSGWYDRFSKRLRSDAALVALAFECQIVERVPNHPHDIRVDTIVTEERIIHCPQD